MASLSLQKRPVQQHIWQCVLRSEPLHVECCYKPNPAMDLFYKQYNGHAMRFIYKPHTSGESLSSAQHPLEATLAECFEHAPTTPWLEYRSVCDFGDTCLCDHACLLGGVACLLATVSFWCAVGRPESCGLHCQCMIRCHLVNGVHSSGEMEQQLFELMRDNLSLTWQLSVNFTI